MIECQREIQTLIKNELSNAELELNVSYYFTSIYDHSLYDSFGKIIQKLWPQVHYIGNMLDGLITVLSFLPNSREIEMQDREGLPLRRHQQDMSRGGLHAYGPAELRDLLGHDRHVYRDVLHLRVRYASARPRRKDESDGNAFDDESSSVIELLTSSKADSNNTYLMLRQVGK